MMAEYAMEPKKRLHQKGWDAWLKYFDGNEIVWGVPIILVLLVIDWLFR